MEQRFRITPEQLDGIWSSWITEDCNDNKFVAWLHGRGSYSDVRRRDYNAQKFEGWLFEHSGRVLQENHVRYAEFTDQNALLMIMLKYG